MKNTVTARRYARAIFEIGQEDGATVVYGDELRTLSEVFKINTVLSKILLNPMYALADRKGLVDNIGKAGEISVKVTRLINILVEKRKLKILDDLIEAYGVMEDDSAGRVRATISAPDELDKSLLDAVTTRLKEETGKNVILELDKNKDLVGGIVIRIGNLILDGSVKTQLAKMKEKLLEGVS